MLVLLEQQIQVVVLVAHQAVIVRQVLQVDQVLLL
jgi:hypothetical protein